MKEDIKGKQKLYNLLRPLAALQEKTRLDFHQDFCAKTISEKRVLGLVDFV